MIGRSDFIRELGRERHGMVRSLQKERKSYTSTANWYVLRVPPSGLKSSVSPQRTVSQCTSFISESSRTDVLLGAFSRRKRPDWSIPKTFSAVLPRWSGQRQEGSGRTVVGFIFPFG